MDLVKIEINNAIALLKEAIINGEESAESLHAWLLSEKNLIETTIEELESILEEAVV